LYLASKQGRIDIVKSLLTQDIDLNYTKNLDSETSLQYLKIVLTLIKQEKIDVNYEEKNDNFTPLTIASRRNHIEIVKLLVGQKDIDVNKMCYFGYLAYTPLMMAIAYKHVEIVKLLLGHGHVDVNKVNERGNYALDFAIVSKDIEIVKLLLNHGSIDVNKISKLGWTPLIKASANKDEKITQLLLEHRDIDVNLIDNDGRTAMNVAAKYGAKEVMELLLCRYDIYFDKQDKEGKTPREIASTMHHVEITHMLNEYEINPIKIRNLFLKQYFSNIVEEFFILFVLISDDYLVCRLEDQNNENTEKNTNKFFELINRLQIITSLKNTTRVLLKGEPSGNFSYKTCTLKDKNMICFFKIVSRLSQDLQEVMAHRMIGSSGNIARSKYVERAIRKYLIKLSELNQIFYWRRSSA
jgi:ankyrin repeat protein